jgi:hypothetical protein
VARALPDDAPGYLPLLDAVQIIGSNETDRMGGYAVRLLTRPNGRIAEILDLLSMLSPDRVCAITTQFLRRDAGDFFAMSPSAGPPIPFRGRG